MHIIIAGEGRTPAFLANSFLSKGYRVTIVLADPAEAEMLAGTTKAIVICGDATDPEILRKADAYYCDLLVAVTDRDENNLIISQLAKLEFGITQTLALANDPDNVAVFAKIGCKSFSPTRLISQLIEQSVQIDDIVSLVASEEGKILLTEFKLNPSTPILGIPLKDLPKPRNFLLVSIVRDNEVIVPNGESVLEKDDKILVLSMPDSHSQVVRMITEEGI